MARYYCFFCERPTTVAIYSLTNSGIAFVLLPPLVKNTFGMLKSH